MPGSRKAQTGERDSGRRTARSPEPQLRDPVIAEERCRTCPTTHSPSAYGRAGDADRQTQSSPVWKSFSSKKGATVTPEAGSPARASSRLGARGGFEGCRHVGQAADARRSTSGVLATRSGSRTANYGREASYARHDRASLCQARCRRALKASLEGSRSPGPQSLTGPGPCAGAVWHFGRALAE